VLAKHSKSFSLIDCIAVGVDRMQRNFEPMRKQVETWQRSELTDVTAKVVIYEAFVEGKLEAPKHLARNVLGSRAWNSIAGMCPCPVVKATTWYPRNARVSLLLALNEDVKESYTCFTVQTLHLRANLSLCALLAR
jgi:hypothetical protein